MNILQCRIRENTLFVEATEIDELGRSVGGPVTLQIPASSDLLAALAEQTDKCVAAQAAVIAQAKLDVADGKTPGKLVASPEDIASAVAAISV